MVSRLEQLVHDPHSDTTGVLHNVNITEYTFEWTEPPVG